jgi:hypothetical protein
MDQRGATVDQSPEIAPGTAPPPPPANPFDIPDLTDEEVALIQRTNRRRIALWGVATGGVMALLVLVCIGLIFAAQNA